MTELLLKVTLNLIIVTPILSGFSRTRGGHAENYVIKKIISERQFALNDRNVSKKYNEKRVEY